MARMNFSGGEEEKKPGTGTGAETGTGESSGTGNKGNTGAGSSSGNSGSAAEKNYGHDADWYRKIKENAADEKRPGNSSGTGTSAGTPQTNEQKAETSLADLRNEYSQMLQDKYNYNAQKLKEEKDAALRENWILQQQTQAALPEQLAAAGLNGGATETSLADLRAMYQGQHNDIQGNYMQSLADLGQQHLTEEAQSAQSYNEKWLEYLLNIAQAEAAAKYNK